MGRDLENLRADYLKDQQTVHKANHKKFWASISSVVPGKKSATNFIWLKHETTKAELEQERVAHYMNTFFTTVGPELAKKTQRGLDLLWVRGGRINRGFSDRC